MPEQTATTATAEQPIPDDGALVESELLVEDVSIDGMCGVY
jgi:mycofactocin precursor